MTPYLFFLIFLGVMGVLNLYIYRRLFTKLHFELKPFGLLLCSTLFALQLLFVLEIASGALFIPSALFLVVSGSVGITFLLFVVTLVYDILHTPAHRIPFDQSRRHFIKIVFDSTMLIIAVAYVFKGIAGGFQRPVINRVKITIKDFPFENLKIVQLSDIHIGRTIAESFVRELVERVNMLEADLVVITGDLVDLEVEIIAESLAPLKALKSRYGSYFILGNHEYFHGPQAIIDHIRTLGITPLLNESVIIREGEAAFNLVGINDLVSKRIGVLPYDVEKAFSQCDTSLATIVLAHQPKSVTITAHHEYDLMLSGHTHGGQIFPFGFLVMIDQPYFAGHYRIDERKQIFVSRGTGYWGPPIRLLAPSEITLLSLSAQS